MTRSYGRDRPSQRYIALIEQYRGLHRDGEPTLNLPPEMVYRGDSLPKYVRQIRDMIVEHSAQTLLDYGAGKGLQYTGLELSIPGEGDFSSIPAYWGTPPPRCYDPAYPPFSDPPEGTFDGVLCTDVLEHCPEDDLDWIIAELFGHARKFVFASISCVAAMKTLPNGENAHCTVRPRAWWEQIILAVAPAFPAIHFQFVLEDNVTGQDGDRAPRITPIVGRGAIGERKKSVVLRRVR